MKNKEGKLKKKELFLNPLRLLTINIKFLSLSLRDSSGGGICSCRGIKSTTAFHRQNFPPLLLPQPFSWFPHSRRVGHFIPLRKLHWKIHTHKDLLQSSTQNSPFARFFICFLLPPASSLTFVKHLVLHRKRSKVGVTYLV